MLFAYGTEATFQHFAAQALAAAKLLRTHSPHLSIALVSSYYNTSYDEIFDHQIIVREDHNFAGSNYQNRGDKLNRQWLSRILYLTATPYKVTLAYDANIISCGDLLPSLQRLASSDFDIAVASIGSSGNDDDDISPHNFALAFRWSDVTAELFDEWFMTQVSAGVALDDQHTLLRAVRTLQSRSKHVRFRTLNPTIAAAFASTDSANGFYPRETRVISQKALIIHDNPAKAVRNCGIFNANPNMRRQMIFDGRSFSVVNSSAECAVKLSRPTCKYNALWSVDLDMKLIPPVIR